MQVMQVAMERQIIDGWTLVHFLSGCAAAQLQIKESHALIAAIVYELLEQPFVRSKAAKTIVPTWRPESIANQAVDVLVFWAGYRLAK